MSLKENRSVALARIFSLFLSFGTNDWGWRRDVGRKYWRRDEKRGDKRRRKEGNNMAPNPSQNPRHHTASPRPTNSAELGRTKPNERRAEYKRSGEQNPRQSSWSDDSHPEPLPARPPNSYLLGEPLSVHPGALP